MYDTLLNKTPLNCSGLTIVQYLLGLYVVLNETPPTRTILTLTRTKPLLEVHAIR